MAKELGAREALFCEYYKILHSPREAAARAGYSFPEKSAIRLMKKASVKRRLGELDEKTKLADEGFRRIAFGSIADAVYLCTRGEVPDRETIEQLDLFMVSEIKFSKSGGIEIKFYDRLKALEQLSAHTETAGGKAEPFFRALSESAKSLAFVAEDEDGI